MEKIKSDRVRELCSLIQTERDQQKFLSLVQELNQILSEDENNEDENNHEGGFRANSSRAIDQNQPPST